MAPDKVVNDLDSHTGSAADEGYALAMDEKLDADLPSTTYLAIRRRIDWHIIPIVAVTYLLCFLDRSNIGNAKLLHLEEELGMSQTDYSWSLSIFFFGYILLEVPANLALRQTSPSRWIGFIVTLWGTFCCCVAAVQNAAGLLSLRFFLGCAEAGFLPGVVYYMTLWYHQREISMRISMFYVSIVLAGALGGVLSYAVSFMDGIRGLSAWRWLFLIEGLPTVMVGIAIFFVLPDSPQQSRWLSSSDKTRIEQHLQGTLEPTDVNLTSTWGAWTNGYTYVHALIMLSAGLPVYSISFLMSTVIRDLGYSNLSAQLLTIPPFLVAAVFMVTSSYTVDRTSNRAYPIALGLVISITGFILLATLDSSTGKYISLFLATVGPYNVSPINYAWLASNITSRSQRAVAIAIVTAVANISGVLAGQMYRQSEAPNYVASHIGNAVSLAVCLVTCLGLQYHQRHHSLSEPAAKPAVVNGAH